MAALVGAIALFALLGLSYLLTAGLVYLVCLGFGFEWSWLLSLGVWALLILLRSVFKNSSKD